MTLRFGSKTDVGRKRRSNQDCHVIVRGEALNGELDALVVVADGMGGKLGGEVASDIVVRAVPKSVADYLAARNGDKGSIDARAVLESALREAHLKVRERQAGDLQLSGMGTTCVAAVLDGNLLTVANVGDSRAYLLRSGRLRQITQDHSSVWEQVLAGAMTPDEARTSPFRNQITRSVGSEVNARPDIEAIELEEGDEVLLCSDGLTSEIEDDEIARLLAGESDPQIACDRLVTAALEAGGRDNVTVLALQYGPFSPVALPRREREQPSADDDPLEAWKSAGLAPTDGEASGRDRVYRAGRRGAFSPIALMLLFLLAVAAGGEAFALYRLRHEIDALRAAPARVIPAPVDRPTDHDLKYGDPVPLASKALRDSPLAADDEGGVLAATSDGSLVHIDSHGLVAALPEQKKLLPAAPAAAHGPLLLATDASGNRYQINPGAKVISKFDPDGVLKLGNIGLGKLSSPTALTVDKAGNLYVIDSHQAKTIMAEPTAAAPNHR